MTEVDRGYARAPNSNSSFVTVAVPQVCSYCGNRGHVWTECRQMKKAVESGNIKKHSATPATSQPSSESSNKKKKTKSVNNLALTSSGMTISLSFLQVPSSSSSPSPSEIVLTLDSSSSVNVFNELSLLSSFSESAEGIVGVGGVSAIASLIGRSVFGPAYFLEGNPFNIVSVHQLRELGAPSWMPSDFSAWYVTIPMLVTSTSGLFHCVVSLPRVQAVALLTCCDSFHC
jgi:hypothetical protein